MTNIITKYRDVRRTGDSHYGALFSKLEKYESRSMHGQLPLAWGKAKDFSVWDLTGNKYIDFSSTIFVANVGHANEAVQEAVITQIESDLISAYSYPTEVRAQYLEKLVKFAGEGFDKAFLLSSGTEAMDAVYKLSKMNGRAIGKRRSGVVTFAGNWHGRTLGAQLLTTNYAQKDWIGFTDPDIHYLDFPLPWNISEKEGAEFFDAQIASLRLRGVDPETDLAVFVLETFQGWGALFYPLTFVRRLREYADANSILVAFDEMQSGFSRTGKNFGFQHYEVVPDLIACGKGMGGGFAVSGVIGRAGILDLPEIGNMSSTHSANPIACAAGLAVLSEIERMGLNVRSLELGSLLHQELDRLRQDFPEVIHSTHGKGLIGSIIFGGDKLKASTFATRVCQRSLSNGLILVHTGRESIKIGPPLVIDREALMEGLEVLREAVSYWSKMNES